MNIFGLGAESVFFFGLLLGFLMAIVPGPGITQVLTYSFKGLTARAWKSAWGVVLADMIIILVCLLSYSWISMLSNNPWIRFSGGLFLLGFAVKSFFSKHKREEKTSATPFQSNFKITLLNPNIWIALISMAAIAFQNINTGLLFMVGIELGCLIWLSIVIHYASKLPSRSHQIIHRGAMFFIAASGVYVMTSAVMT